MGALSKHVGAFDTNIALGPLPPLFLSLIFNRQQNLDIHHLVKVTQDAVKLGRDITAQGRGDFKVMAADRQVHK
jgi:hypothetical protein